MEKRSQATRNLPQGIRQASGGEGILDRAATADEVNYTYWIEAVEPRREQDISIGTAFGRGMVFGAVVAGLFSLLVLWAAGVKL
jgi:hypothetical protein